MARNWMINPRIHCRNHLLGAHCECHMVVGILRKKTRIDGFIKNHCIEVSSLIKYHDILADEMLRRGGNHNTPITSIPDISHLTEHQINFKIDRDYSFNLLITRCDICKDNYLKLKDELKYLFV